MIKFGLLWYDPSPRRPVRDKVDQAAARYREKFGLEPDTCLVNPQDLVPDAQPHVSPRASIQRHHFLIGRDETAHGLQFDARAAIDPGDAGLGETHGPSDGSTVGKGEYSRPGARGQRAVTAGPLPVASAEQASQRRSRKS